LKQDQQACSIEPEYYRYLNINSHKVPNHIYTTTKVLTYNRYRQEFKPKKEQSTLIVWTNQIFNSLKDYNDPYT